LVQFKVFGPFPMLRSNGQIDKSREAKADLWARVEETAPGLSYAVGCYVYTIGAKPWYVGAAERQSFRQECFTPHKLLAYNSALNKVKKGRPSIFLVAKLTPTRRFAKPTKNQHKATLFLENLMIGQALTRNSQLENIRGTTFLKRLVAPGVVNTPPGAAAAKAVIALRAKLGT
jgi:hypothetical protein